MFAWLCRIAGSAAAMQLLPQTYPALADRATVDRDDLLAVALRLAIAAGGTATPDGDDAELTPMERALLELGPGRGRSDDDIARVTGLATEDVPEAVVEAAARARSLHPGTAIDEIGSRREAWLDDDTRERCRAAIRGADDVPAGAEAAVGETRARRWRIAGAAAAAAAVALIIAGLVWSRSATEPHNPRADQRILGQTVGYVLSAPPDGFGPTGTSGDQDASRPLGQLQIWAEPGATRTVGRWFAVLVATCAPIDSIVLVDAARVTISARPGLLSHDADGVAVVRVQFGTNELTSQTLEVRGHGLDDDELEQIASSVLLGSSVKDPTELPRPACDASAPVDDIEFDNTFDAARGDLVIQTSVPWYAATTESADHDGSIRFQAAYASVDQIDDATVTVTTHRRSEARDTVARFLRLDSTDPGRPEEPDRLAVVDGQRVVVAAQLVPGGAPQNIVTWSAAGETVDVASDLPVRALLPLVATLRVATADDEAALARLPPPPTTDSPDPRAAIGIGISTTTSGETWIASVEPDSGTLHLRLQGTAVDAQFALVPDAEHPVHEFDTAGATLLVVAMPGDFSDGTISVTVATVHLPPVAFTSIASTSAVGQASYALIAFSEAGEHQLEFIRFAG